MAANIGVITPDIDFFHDSIRTTMNKERLVELGAHAELLARNRLYARLYRMQSGRKLELRAKPGGEVLSDTQ